MKRGKAIFTMTEAGRLQGERFLKLLPEARLYAFPDSELGVSFSEQVKESFQSCELLIFVMATGIVVRTIAPLLQDKTKDPAVLVMDQQGRHLISLLSGHQGGANGWTRSLAAELGAVPVITTASDLVGVKAVDTFAQENQLALTDWTLAKEITARLVAGKSVPIYWPQAGADLPGEYVAVEELDALDQKAYALVVSEEAGSLPSRWLQLVPRQWVVGIGCKKDTPAPDILENLEQAFQELGKSIKGILKLATVDVKAHEPGILELARQLEVPLEIISRQQIAAVEHLFDASPFVFKTIGVGSVSEPCAYLASQGGELRLQRRTGKGNTIAIAAFTSELKGEIRHEP